MIAAASTAMLVCDIKVWQVYAVPVTGSGTAECHVACLLAVPLLAVPLLVAPLLVVPLHWSIWCDPSSLFITLRHLVQ